MRDKRYIPDYSIDSEYVGWLFERVDGPALDEYLDVMMTILAILHNTKFEVVLPMDENRAKDGISLRNIWLFERPCDYQNSDEFRVWMSMPCSVLEALVALSEKMVMQLDSSVSFCFATLLDNIGIKRYRNYVELGAVEAEDISRRLDIFMRRKYNPDGTGGGAFPIEGTNIDMLQTELLYQMYAYVRRIVY